MPCIGITALLGADFPFLGWEWPSSSAAACHPRWHSTLAPAPPHLCCHRSQGTVINHGSCRSAQADAAGRDELEPAPWHGPGRVHAQAVATREWMEAKERLSAQISSKGCRMDPSLAQYDGHGHPHARTHSWMIASARQCLSRAGSSFPSA